MTIDNWTPLNAPASNYRRYAPADLEAAALAAEQAGDIAAATELRKAAQIERDAELLRRTGGEGREFAPLSGMSGPERFVRGADLARRNLGRGAAEAVGIEVADKPPEKARRDEFLMRSPAGVAGNIAGNVAVAAPTALIPGANTVTGATVIGATMGALQPTGERGFGSERLSNTAWGGVGGFIGGGISKGINRAMNVGVTDDAAQLMDEGVRVTPGRAIGRGVAEDRLTGVPFVGDDVVGGQQRALSDFNKVTINNMLKPLDGHFDVSGSPLLRQVDDIGHAGIEAAQDIVNNAYSSLYAKVPVVTLDDTFTQELGRLLAMSKQTMPKRLHNRFVRILNENMPESARTTGKLTGESLKRWQSQMRKEAEKLLKSNDALQRDMGDAFRTVSLQLKHVLGRNNPQAYDELLDIDRAYAGLKLLQKAASYKGAQEGVFTPEMWLGSVRSGMDEGVIARGGAYGQDFGNRARNVLGNKYPDSGTASRATMNALVTGAPIAIGTGYVAPSAILPSAGLLGVIKAGSMAAYSPLGTRLLTRRPDYVRQLGQYAGDLIAPSGAMGGMVLSQ